MKCIMVTLSSLLITSTIFAMDSEQAITFYNKNLSTISIHFQFFNYQTNTFTNFSHRIDYGNEKTFDFSNVFCLCKPKVKFNNTEFRSMSFTLNQDDSDIITFKKNDTCIVAINKSNIIIGQRYIITDQPNLSNSR